VLRVLRTRHRVVSASSTPVQPALNPITTGARLQLPGGCSPVLPDGTNRQRCSSDADEPPLTVPAKSGNQNVPLVPIRSQEFQLHLQQTPLRSILYLGRPIRRYPHGAWFLGRAIFLVGSILAVEIYLGCLPCDLYGSTKPEYSRGDFTETNTRFPLYRSWRSNIGKHSPFFFPFPRDNGIAAMPIAEPPSVVFRRPAIG
jgi:hypothetical protein